KKPGSDKESDPANTVVTGEDKVADKPKIDPIKETDKEITGKGTPGDKIIVRDPEGKVIGETTVDKDGKWKLDVPEGTKLNKGDDITATSKKPGSDKESDPANTIVTGEDKVADKPAIDPIKETDKEITGKGTPGDKIIVRDPEGKVIGETTVDKDGKWKLDVSEGTKLNKGDDITATSKKPGSDKESDPANTIVTGEDKDGANTDNTVVDKPNIDLKQDKNPGNMLPKTGGEIMSNMQFLGGILGGILILFGLLIMASKRKENN
ncbi:Ig-like domain-containing protein, partial [Bacillus cereus]|nr:Ig-like domain-containing protein [Bacillus cereus]